MTDEKTPRPILSVKHPSGPKRAQARRKAVAKEQGDLSSIAAGIITPTEETIREIRTRIEDAFNALGTDSLPGTVLPAGNKNNSKEAVDYVVADLLNKLASERLKTATQAAENAGVFGDPADYVSGDTVMVFNDPNFSINVKKGRASKMIKRELVEQAAAAHLGKKATEFLSECMGERKPTTRIIVSMK